METELYEKLKMPSHRLSDEEIDIVSSWFTHYKTYAISGICPFELTDQRKFASSSPYFDQLINLFGTEDKPHIYNQKYAWISPNGKYYSCAYGGHEIKAQMILRANENCMRSFLSQFDNYESALYCLTNFTGNNNPSDFLLAHNWCRLQSNGFNNVIALTNDTVHLTKQQIDTLFAVTMKYKFSKDPVTGNQIHWDKLRDC